METPVLLWFHLLLSVIVCHGFHVQGPSGALTVQFGGSVVLPCFVETPLPMEELEVKWTRIDSESLVHLWQNGESQTVSQTQSYRERAHFFTEEVAHGNFSLLLTNITQEDAGVYKCLVLTNQDSGETLIEIMEIERLIVSGAHVISAYAGEDITLNCSVDSHIPSERLEQVSWRKTDEEILVLLYQEGDILTDSTHERFMGRVEFFSAEDRNKGNFSMRLKDVRTDDKGLYMCLAFSGDLSDNTTVEVQQLGFSSVHIGMIVLCILGFVIGSLILGYRSYACFQNKGIILLIPNPDNKKKALVIQCAPLLCPNITMFIVFILWGVTDGLYTEAATCSALNFVRICFFGWIAYHLESFKGVIPLILTRLAFSVQYFVIILVAYIPIIVDIWHSVNTAWVVGMLIFFLLGTVTNIFNDIFWYFSGRFRCNIDTRICCGSVWRFMMGPATLFTPFFTIFFYNAVNVKEQEALICVTVFFIILSVMTMELYITFYKSSESLYGVFVFMIGSVLVVFVNAAALLVELILKARNGERTVDLRLILIPTECVFAVCLLALRIYDFCTEKEITFQPSDDQPSDDQPSDDQPSNDQPSNDHELQSLASGS